LADILVYSKDLHNENDICPDNVMGQQFGNEVYISVYKGLQNENYKSLRIDACFLVCMSLHTEIYEEFRILNCNSL